ncbi:hypothetical protein D3C71_1036760 [compost metagenome]
MNSKLREFVIENSFERFVYKGMSGLMLNVFFTIMTISLFLIIGSVIGIDFDNLKQRLISISICGALFIISVIIVYVIGNKASKKVLNSKVFPVKKRNNNYRLKVKKVIKKEFLFEEGAFSKMKIGEAIEILESNKSQIKSEYSKIVFVFASITGIVWYQFVETIFKWFSYQNVSEIFYVFFYLLVFCMIILLVYFYIRMFVTSFTSIGKIDSFVGILQEIEYETR